MALGGLLLIVTHGSVAPWSWNQDPHQRFPTSRESLDAMTMWPLSRRGSAGGVHAYKVNISAKRRIPPESDALHVHEGTTGSTSSAASCG